LRFLLSLPTADVGYHSEQAEAAIAAARRCNVQLEIVHAEGDAITQSQQILRHVQSKSQRPDAVLLEPVGTCLPVTADAAVNAGVGWAVLNREADYIDRLSARSRAPLFEFSTDHTEVGRIQGRQFQRLLPEGGDMLYLSGPAGNGAAQRRLEGMQETKPGNIEVKMMRGNWTEQGAEHAVTSLLQLQTSRLTHFRLIGCQNDAMAVGARRALSHTFHGLEREQWMRIPCTGCDGLKDVGLPLVDSHELAATIIIPPNAGDAIEMMAAALHDGNRPPLRSYTTPLSYPDYAKLSIH